MRTILPIITSTYAFCQSIVSIQSSVEKLAFFQAIEETEAIAYPSPPFSSRLFCISSKYAFIERCASSL